MPRTVDSPVYQKAQVLDALRDTGALIAEARKARGWSQTDLGARLGKVDRRHVSALEKGDPKVDVGLVVAAGRSNTCHPARTGGSPDDMVARGPRSSRTPMTLESPRSQC